MYDAGCVQYCFRVKANVFGIYLNNSSVTLTSSFACIYFSVFCSHEIRFRVKSNKESKENSSNTKIKRKTELRMCVCLHLWQHCVSCIFKLATNRTVFRDQTQRNIQTICRFKEEHTTFTLINCHCNSISNETYG